MRHFKVWFLAFVLALGSILAQGCDEPMEPDWTRIIQTQLTSSVLANIRRADGSDIPDLVQIIQDQYGFRAQVMNFVVPSVTIALTSSVAETDPSRFSAIAQVTGWKTVAPTVVNDVQSVDFTLQINGTTFEDCYSYTGSDNECLAYKTFFAEYLNLYADLVQGELNQNLSLQILGEDAEGGQKVLSLSPSTIDYACIGDRSKLTYTKSPLYYWIQDGAIQCAGKVTFAIDSTSARVAKPTQEQIEQAAVTGLRL